MGSSNLQSVKDRAKDAIATAEWTEAIDIKERHRVSQFAQRLGAIKAVAVLGHHLSSTAFREFQQYVEDNDGEAWRAIGRYTNLVDFLNSPDSPMTKHQYYSRRDAITREGDIAFDLLNALDISLRGRKLLGEGEIRIEEEEVVIGDNHIPISDRTQVRAIIATLIESRSTAQDTIEKQSRVIERGRKDVDKYKRRLVDAERRGGVPTDATPHGQALLTLVGSYRKLCDEIIEYREAVEPGSEHDGEFHVFKKTVIDTLGNCYRDLTEAFDITMPPDAENIDLAAAADLFDES